MQLDYEQSIKAAEERAAAEQHRQDTERGLREVYSAFPQLIRNEATDKILRAYCGSNPVSLEVVMYGFNSADSNLIEQVQFVTDAQARENFIDKLVTLSGGSAASQQFLRTQLSARVSGSSQNIYSTQQLQEKAQEKEKQVALRKMTPDAVTEITKTSTDSNLVGATIAAENTLKQTHRLIDGRYYASIPADITSLSIKKADVGTIRRLTKIYHYQQVNERLMGRN